MGFCLGWEIGGVWLCFFGMVGKWGNGMGPGEGSKPILFALEVGEAPAARGRDIYRPTAKPPLFF